MDEFAEDIPHWPSNIYYVGDVSMYYLAKSVLLLITDTPETNRPASNLLYPHLFPVRLSNTQRSNRPSASNNTHYSHQNDDVFPVRSTYQSACPP